MLIYRLISTLQPTVERTGRAWVDPGVPISVGPSRWLTCFFDAQRLRPDQHHIPAYWTGYQLRLRYTTPLRELCFDYEDVQSSITMQDAELICLPRAMESFAYGHPRRLLLDFYSLRAIEWSLSL